MAAGVGKGGWGGGGGGTQNTGDTGRGHVVAADCMICVQLRIFAYQGAGGCGGRGGEGLRPAG